MKWCDPFQKWWASIAGKRPECASASPAAGWIVDLVGPSGVGKSALCKKMFSDMESGEEAPWFSSRELAETIRRHRRDEPALSMPLSLLDTQAEALVGRLLK